MKCVNGLRSLEQDPVQDHQLVTEALNSRAVVRLEALQWSDQVTNDSTSHQPTESNGLTVKETDGSGAEQRTISRRPRDTQYECDLCEYICTSRYYIRRHMSTHTGYKPYQCDFCDYKSAYKKELLLHTRTHTGDKPHECDLCEYRTGNRYNLKGHMRTHNPTEQEPDRRTHTEDKPYKCGMCDYRAVNTSHLKRHLRVRSGEKPYKCSYCDYKTSQRCHLRHHVTKHTNNKKQETLKM